MSRRPVTVSEFYGTTRATKLRIRDTIQTAWPSREPGMLLAESLGLVQWVGIAVLVVLADCAYASLLGGP